MRANRARTVAMLIFLVFAGLSEGIGVATLLPLVDTLSTQGAGSPSSPFTTILNHLGISHETGPLLALVAVMVALKGGLLFLAMAQAGYAVAQVATDLRLRVLRAVLGTEWGYFVDHPLGTVSNAIAVEAQRAGQAYFSACQMLANVVQVSIYGVLAFMIAPIITLYTVIATPLIFLVFAPLVRSAKHAGQTQTGVQKRLMSWIENGLQGIKPIKAMGQEDYVGPLLRNDIENLKMALRKQVFSVQGLKTIQEPIVVGALMAVIYGLVTWGDMPISSLLVLAILFYRVSTRFLGLQAHYQNLMINHSAYWSLDDLCTTATRRAERNGKTAITDFRDGIRFNGVSINYGAHRVIDDVHLDLPVRGVVVFRGPSGAGKTTLIDSLVGLVEPSDGEILIDGIPLANCDKRTWRRMIGYVPQEMSLFHDTVKNNIKLGAPGISDDDVERAITAAGLDEVIAGLAEGLDTVVGERGSKFSGGQRQRLAMARALARKPKVLILDEVTTALDPATEKAVCDTITTIGRDALVIAISHQDAVTSIADMVVHVEGGRAEVEVMTVAS